MENKQAGFWFDGFGLPSDWTVLPVKKLCSSIGSGSTPNSGEDRYYSDGTIPWINISDMSQGGIIRSSEKRITERAIADKGMTLYSPGTVLYAMYASVGKVAILGISAAINQALLALTPQTNLFGKFLYYCFVAMEPFVKFESNGSTQCNLSAKKIKNFPIPTPPFNEQRIIAEYLDDCCQRVDALRQNEEKQIEMLVEYKRAIITKTVTKGLEPYVSLKESGVGWIGQIPENWQTMRIKYSSWLKGRIGWDGLKSTEFVEKGPYLITGTDFRKGQIDWETCVHITEERYAEDVQLHIKENDLLITKDGTVGKLAIVKNCPEKVSLNSGVMIIRNVGTYPYADKYLYYVLQSKQFFDWYEMSQSGNSTIKHLYQNQFYDFEFTFPNIDDQYNIASFLDNKVAEIDRSIEIKRKKIQSLCDFKASLIFEYVTGKKRV